MYNIYCLQRFNNYYNRIVKKFNTIKEYQTYQEDRGLSIISYENINFNPNDCVNSSQIINWDKNWLPDYFITEDIDTGVFMRWFVMESSRQRGSQYLFTLRRDLLVDYFDTIKKAPCFIEKANLNSSDSFIYNNEGMTFNQIKYGEKQLKDKSNCPWIVGYYSEEDEDVDDIDTPSNIHYDEFISGTYDESEIKKLVDKGIVNIGKSYGFFLPARNTKSPDWAGMYALEFDGYSNQFEDYAAFGNFFEAKDSSEFIKYYSNIIFEKDTGVYMGDKNFNFNTIFDDDNINPYEKLVEPFSGKFNEFNNKLKNQEYFDSLTFYDFSNNFLKYKDKVVKFVSTDGEEEFYQFNIEKILEPDLEGDYVNSTGDNVKVVQPRKQNTQDTLWTSFYNTQKKTYGFDTGGSLGNNFYYYLDIIYNQYRITATPITFKRYRTSIKGNKNKLIDNPYSIFAIPYLEENNKKDSLKIMKDTVELDVKRNISLTVANSIVRRLQPQRGGSNGRIIDLQLLPYCPVPELITADGVISLPELPPVEGQSSVQFDEYYFEPIYTLNGDVPDTTPVSYIFFPKKSSFTIDNIDMNIPAYDKKINSQTDFYRLVSPNFNGQFEFNLEKNNGINYINVDCTYKPYNPYIHLNPNFSGLYGEDWNDSRGLICAGDFSLSMMSDAWEQYQITNKNYQNIFDREIKNMEVNNSVARQRDIFNGVIGGMLTGAMTGLTSGMNNNWSGLVKGASGIAGGLVNYELGETLRNEAIDYKKDQFGYTLGNIQALPQSIAKTTALTANNKIFPILEYYSCTKEEKLALANKIAWNGMTVMRIGTINDFINNGWSYTIEGTTITSKNYIKGQLIRIEDLNCDDFHVANEIANEVFKGAFYETKF